jgi:hypothetical protein
MPFSWTRNSSSGRHVRTPVVPQPREAQAFAAPPPGSRRMVPHPGMLRPAVAVPAFTLGAGVRLVAGGPPDDGPVFAGLRSLGNGRAAVISLGGGWCVDVTRTLWLDDLVAAVRDARDALMRDERETRKAAASPSEDPPDEDGTRMLWQLPRSPGGPPPARRGSG